MTITLCVLNFVKKLQYCIALLIYLSLCSNAYAKNDNVYTVAKFKVEATAQNAVRAKAKAIATGRVEAFYYLLRRITSYSAYSRLPKVDPKTIESLLDSLTVRDSKNSRVRYIASLDFNFRADSIRKLLRSYSIPFLEEQSKKIIVLPVYLTEDQSRQATNIKRDWRTAWNRQDMVHILTPVQLGHLKAVASTENIQAVLNGNRNIFRQISSEYKQTYKVDNFLMAIAYPSQKPGKMKVSLVGSDGVGPIFLDREYQFDSSRGRWDSEKAAHYSLQVLEGRWKIIRSEELGGDEVASAPESVLVTVIFSGFKEWQQIRQKISDVPGVDGLEVGSLSARGAELSLSYPGGAERLSQKLGQYKLVLQNENGAWILREP